MEPRISMITLGVSDLGRSVSFYRDILGFPLSQHSVENAVAFFELNGTWLALFSREELAKDAHVQNNGPGFDGVALAHNLKSEEEVKHFFDTLKAKGLPITKEPVKADWGGFSGYFKDPDGHLWEVAYNPEFWIGPRPGGTLPAAGLPASPLIQTNALPGRRWGWAGSNPAPGMRVDRYPVRLSTPH